MRIPMICTRLAIVTFIAMFAALGGCSSHVDRWDLIQDIYGDVEWGKVVIRAEPGAVVHVAAGRLDADGCWVQALPQVGFASPAFDGFAVVEVPGTPDSTRTHFAVIVYVEPDDEAWIAARTALTPVFEASPGALTYVGSVTPKTILAETRIKPDGSFEMTTGFGLEYAYRPDGVDLELAELEIADGELPLVMAEATMAHVQARDLEEGANRLLGAFKALPDWNRKRPHVDVPYVNPSGFFMPDIKTFFP